MNQNYELQSKVLHSLLDLDRDVVGVKLFHDKNLFNSFPFKERKRKKAYCSMVKDASNGDTSKLCGINFACRGSAQALGMIEEDLYNSSGIRRKCYGGFENLSLSRTISRESVYCSNIYYGVAVGSLSKFIEAPDIILLVTTSYNVMRIIQGYGYTYGNNDGFNVIGLGAICHEVTSIPFELNKLNISFLCPGTRMLCGWKESEVAIGIPYNYFIGIINGVLQTINPFERDKKKYYIEQKLKQLSLDFKYKIKYDFNYDTGAYKGLTSEERNIFLKTKR